MTDFFKRVQIFWRKNGTKMIGYMTTAIGFLATADKELVGVMFTENGLRWLLLASGLATALRGHTNTAAIKDEIRTEEMAKVEAVKSEKEGG